MLLLGDFTVGDLVDLPSELYFLDWIDKGWLSELLELLFLSLEGVRSELLLRCLDVGDCEAPPDWLCFLDFGERSFPGFDP